MSRSKNKGVHVVSPTSDLNVEEVGKVYPLVKGIILTLPDLKDPFLSRGAYVSLIEDVFQLS